jgi:hypothetical protein
MPPENQNLWQQDGARATTSARDTGRFVDQHISPLFFRRTNDGSKARDCTNITSEEQFWGKGGSVIFGAVRLNGFRVTDWFPRTPGVYWSQDAQMVRELVDSRPPTNDPELGMIFSPESKMNLIEQGGIGTIRLRPKRIDGEDCWLATALTGSKCHCGIPLAVPNGLLRESGVTWGDRVNIRGRVRFLQEAGLDDTAAYVHHARPLIVFVDELEGVTNSSPREPIVISPVALFEPANSESHEYGDRAQYTFVQCAADSDSELDAAVNWIGRYATKYAGRVITNFDEQRPVLADAPLSYQRLVAKTYDRTVIEHFGGTIRADRIDKLFYESKTTVNYGDTHVGHNINVTGSANINIDSLLSNVTQTIETAPGLDSAQKSKLDSLVQSLKSDLENVKASHADETKEIIDAVEKAVTIAAKPPQERKQSLLELSAKGLREAAELVRDVAPNILTTAGLIAKFITGL